MPRKGGKGSGGRRPRRRLLATSAMMGAVAKGVSTAVKYAPTAIKAVRAAKAAYAKAQSLRKQYSGVKTFKVHRAGDMGYIPPHNFVAGKPSTNLSVSEKVQSIINPPQSFNYIQAGKLDATSTTQNVSGFVLTNNYWGEICAQFPNLVAEGTTAQNQYVSTGPTNRFLHKSSAIYHTFMNSSTLTAELEIYTYQAVQDVDSLDQFINPASSWAYAEQINNLLGNTLDSVSGTAFPNKRPTDKSVVGVIGRYWGLMDKCKVFIKPGENFKHNTTKHINRVVYQYMLNADNSACLKHHAIGFIYILRGQMVGSSLTSDIGLGDCQVSYTRTIKNTFSIMTQNRKRDVLITNALIPVAAANQVIINTDTGSQVVGYSEDA